MAKKLCVNISMFDFNQDVFMTDGEIIKHVASVPMERLSEIIYSLTGTEDGIEEIEINGNQEYIQPVGYEILEGLNKLYSDKNVRVYLNGEVFN